GLTMLLLSFRLTYICVYNLLQFCGHTWVLTNTIARFFTFGKDALADTFYSVGFVMSLCQLLSFLELYHIADGIEEARLLPRFIHVCTRDLIVILLEEMQSKPVVLHLYCVPIPKKADLFDVFLLFISLVLPYIPSYSFRTEGLELHN
uniref:very-long-chain (3R)-3-hydroxyacyl-CoA dehydratase n=1 Tax=Neogobius melanostomus TaxID=47308 RepID=A0A8C6T371_9GOBI